MQIGLAAIAVAEFLDIVRDERPVLPSNPIEQIPILCGEQSEIADMRSFIAPLVREKGKLHGKILVDRQPGPNGQAARPGRMMRLDFGLAPLGSIRGLPRRGRISAYSFAASSISVVSAG